MLIIQKFHVQIPRVNQKIYNQKEETKGDPP